MSAFVARRACHVLVQPAGRGGLLIMTSSAHREPREITIALAGNPNAGKTTIFNNLTGGNQHVGNYPGVTVEKRQGYFVSDQCRIRVVDLPGIYSLSAWSSEEVIARSFLLTEKARSGGQCR